MHLLDETANGVYSIVATPFDPDGQVDWPGIPALTEFYLNCGVSGLTILGMMGEAPKLTGNESQQFVERMLECIDGRVPVIVGVSASGFASMAELGHFAMDKGAAGLMIQPPATSAKGDDAVFAYCREVVRAIGAQTPWVLQDFPLASNVPMNATLIKRIMEAYPSCKMLKAEDWPGLDKISDLRGSLAPQRPMSILTGNGGIFLPFELMRGSNGAMTGFAYPEMLCAMCRLHAEGEHDKMLDLFDAYLPLVRYEQQPGQGLLARKYILKRRGALSHDAIRAPGGKLSDQSRKELDRLMQRQEIRIAELA